MKWPPGEYVTDFSARYIEAIRAQLTPKQGCRFMLTQLPQEVLPKLKDWVDQQVADLSEDGAVKTGTEMRQALNSKGIPLDRGWRGAVSEKVCVTESVNKAQGMEAHTTDSNTDEEGIVGVVHGQQRKPRKDQRPVTTGRNCFGCGQPGHFIGSYPFKKCAICKQSGHSASIQRWKSQH